MTERTIKVDALTRVEGEGGLYVKMHNNAVDDIRLEIYEPPRLFEALLRGRALEEVPDITARICGICPVAYQMSSVHALEAALGIQITPEIRLLRRLLYCAEWIESHALHIYLLNAPDFLGFESGLEMAAKYPDEAGRGLRLKKHGNQLLEVLGGRAIHPINVAVGGFYRAPSSSAVQRLIPDFEWGLQAAIDTTRWVATFDFPDFTVPYQLVSLAHEDEFPMNEGHVVTSDGESIKVVDYEKEFEERHVAHSTALHSLRKQAGASYPVGPLARVGLCLDRLAPTARQVADEVGVSWPSFNPFQGIVARGLEMIHAFEEALEIMRSYRPPQPSRIDYSYREGAGCAATEAPRGLLYHRYAVNADGKVRKAKIVPPTSQNQAQIEADLREWVPRILSNDDAATARQCENLVRCYDPCISCSTHFLNVEIDRGMNRPRTLFVGIGSSHGDDQAGWLVADRLLAAGTAHHVEVRHAKSPADLLDALEDIERLIVCDACRGLGHAGEVRRWKWPTRELPAMAWSGTHNLPLPAALQMAEQLGRLPLDVVVWGVEGAASGALAPVSPQVSAALPGLVEQIIHELQRGSP